MRSGMRYRWYPATEAGSRVGTRPSKACTTSGAIRDPYTKRDIGAEKETSRGVRAGVIRRAQFRVREGAHLLARTHFGELIDHGFATSSNSQCGHGWSAI
jgi:hypothetical protein